MGIRFALTTAISTAVVGSVLSVSAPLSGATSVSAPLSGASSVSAPLSGASSMLNTHPEVTIKPRLQRTVVEERTMTPIETVTRRTSTLPKDVKKVARTGSQGILVKEYQITTIGTNVLGKRLIDEYVLKQGGPRVIFIGTFVAPKPQPVISTPAPPQREVSVASRDAGSPWPRVRGAEGLNWAALAQCESSGNPLAVNKSGPYYGLYQFLASTWRSVGGTGLPTEASPAEQTYRAKLLWKRSGPGQWPVCGKRL